MDSRIDFDSDGLPIPSQQIQFDEDSLPIPVKKKVGGSSSIKSNPSSPASAPITSPSKSQRFDPATFMRQSRAAVLD